MSYLLPYPSKLAWTPYCDLDVRTPHFCIYLTAITLHCTLLGEVACFLGKKSEKRKLSFKKFYSSWSLITPDFDDFPPQETDKKPNN